MAKNKSKEKVFTERISTQISFDLNAKVESICNRDNIGKGELIRSALRGYVSNYEESNGSVKIKEDIIKRLCKLNFNQIKELIPHIDPFNVTILERLNGLEEKNFKEIGNKITFFYNFEEKDLLYILSVFNKIN